MFPCELDEKVVMRAKKGRKGMIKRNACPQTSRFWYTSLNIWRSVSFVGWQLVNIVAEKQIHQILKNFLFFPTLPYPTLPFPSSPFFFCFVFQLSQQLADKRRPSPITQDSRLELRTRCCRKIEKNGGKWGSGMRLPWALKSIRGLM